MMNVIIEFLRGFSDNYCVFMSMSIVNNREKLYLLEKQVKCEILSVSVIDVISEK